MSGWIPRPYRQGDELGIARLASLVYPGIKAEEYAKLWISKYAGSPKGFVSWVAQGGGEIVGHYGALVSSANLAGKDVLVAQAVDAFTHPQWRRRGIFVGLGGSLLKDLGERGIHIAYGIPNKAAMPGHEKLSWVVAAKIPRFITVLDRKRAIGAYLGGGLKKVAFRVAVTLHGSPGVGDFSPLISMTHPPESWPAIESLWTLAKAGSGVAIDRTREYLSWRYPEQSPRGYTVFMKSDGGQATAAAVCGVGASGIGQISELIHAPEHEEDAGLILRGVLSHFRNGGCHTVEALASTPELKRLLGSERFFKVSNVLLIAHANDAEGAEQVDALSTAERIALSYGDSDLA